MKDKRMLIEEEGLQIKQLEGLSRSPGHHLDIELGQLPHNAVVDEMLQDDDD